MLSAAFLLAGILSVQEKEPPPPPPPRLIVAIPPVVASGGAAKVTIRGLRLDEVTELRLADPVEGAAVVLGPRSKVAVPANQEAAMAGDSQLELELRLPEAGAPETVSLVATGPTGISAPIVVSVVPPDRLEEEKEPNGGFASARALGDGRVVRGSIAAPLDVDVFRIDGRAGERWTIEVTARRRGSAMDPLLWVHDPGGRLLEVSDDVGGNRDALLCVTLPADGAYTLSLLDALDQGGPAHVYQIVARREP